MSINPAAAIAVGIPAAVGLAVYLRVKYGPTIWTDLGIVGRGIVLLREIQNVKDKCITNVDVFESYAQKTPNKSFILYNNDSYSYADIEKETNKMAHFIQHSGVVHLRDTVAVLMYNEPSFISTWFAFNKLGVTTALLNYNLRTGSLLHCIKISEAKAVVCGREQELLDALLEIMPDLQALGITVWVHGRQEEVLPASVSHLDSRNYPEDPIPRTVRNDLTTNDMSCYIFTSGTKGLPKAVNVSYSRAVQAGYVQHDHLGPDDVLYISLPLYHSAALLIGFANILRVGGTAAISHRFSVRKFWDDVRKYRATVIQYIGETCRYLVAQPKRPDDGRYDHKVKLAIGNGLRPDIWEEFQQRFNIETIAEFYAATDGNQMMMNSDGKVGACGRYTPFFKAWVDKLEFIRCDTDTTEPIRDDNGMCITVPPGEPGLLVTKVTDSNPVPGYKASEEVNRNKLLQDVKIKGDVYVNTGDLMSYDKDGYLYFIDRLGDTFRWKGENVATMEVAEVLNKFPGVQEANVYGVKVPKNLDGRAGMAAIVLKDGSTLDINEFYKYVTKNLPTYACPKFLRIMPEMHITGTFKHRKTVLVKEGFDPNLVSDPLYFLEREKETYVPMDTQTLQKIVAGHVRL